MRGERGVALLEVLIAIAILTVAGTAIVALLAEQVRVVEVLREREVEYRRSEEVLARLSMRGARELGLRLGRRNEGAITTHIQRPRPGLYRIAVADSTAPDAELLVTVVFRGEEQ